MRIMALTSLINRAFIYLSTTCSRLNIDESHGLKHGMEVLHLANKIFDSQVKLEPDLLDKKEIISIAAILHDTCDKKYMDEVVGIKNIELFMKDYICKEELDVVKSIISTMSYSKVKKFGYPSLDKYQMAYHIVREADLLSAYDIDRCIIYSMCIEKLEYTDAVKRAIELFEIRVLKYRSDKLFVTNYSKNKSLILHKKALQDIESLKKQIL